MQFTKIFFYAATLTISLFMSCGRPDGAHINEDPNDFVQPDTMVSSDSLIPGQPNGYAPASASDSVAGGHDQSSGASVDSATMGRYQ